MFLTVYVWFLRTSEDRWDVGKCLGIIATSNEEITRDVNIIQSSGSKRQSSYTLSSPSHLPREKPSSSTASKARGLLNFTFTRVQTKNFHRKSELSPVMRWNAAIKKLRERNKESWYDLYENEDDRYLSEFDVKIGSLDLLLDLAVLSPYTRILNLLASVEFPMGDARVSVMPSYSNTTLPLIYLETGALRLFFKTELPPKARLETPDMLTIQVASLTVHSQVRSELHLTQLYDELNILKQNILIAFSLKIR